MRLHYHLVDVFTDQAFGGNPLAVFTNGRGVSDAIMQRIAKELNLSETTFILPPSDPANTCQVRIFTPASELLMAGHPTIGTAFVMAQQRLLDIPPNTEQITIRFEEKVGVIPVELTFNAGAVGRITMDQLLPTFGEIVSDKNAAAALLNLDESDLLPDYPVQVVSCGMPFLFIPLKNREAVARARLRLDLWEANFKTHKEVFIFALDPETPQGTVHSRMFAPGIGIPEDPATGGASGPLGCYLFQHGLVPQAPQVEIVSEQGFEMGRPSFIYITLHSEGEQIKRVQVGGQSVYMGEGFFML